MAQEMKAQVDRDTHVAALLAGSTVDNFHTASEIVERFEKILAAIVKAGGTHGMWMKACDPEGKGPSVTIL
jgi:hypothetical protein